jgi:predicted O-linked N-acetylglucosamine transferase (SPINDLY family)
MNPRSVDPVIARARELVAEQREADAAALLELRPSPPTNALHREIALRAATNALQARDIAPAVAWLDRGLRLAPADPVLNFFRGNLHQDSGHLDAAIGCFRHCVAAQPHREEFVCNLGHALVAAGAFEQAVSTLAALPESALANLNLGTAYEKMGDLHRAGAHYEQAARLKPDLFAAWLNLGAVRDRLEDRHGALTAFNRAVALNPASPNAHLERGRLLLHLKRTDEACKSFDRAVALAPRSLPAALELACARLRLCDWDRAPDAWEQIRRDAVESAAQGKPVDPFTLLILPSRAPQRSLREVAHARCTRSFQTVAPDRKSAPESLSRPLRVGYVSPDFGNHAVGNCLRSLLARHDRNRVSIHGFSLSPLPEDDCRTAIRAGCDSWEDLNGVDDDSSVRRIAGYDLDLLVDLAGHTKGNRIQLFARRPAPIQVSWLGYPGTTGAPFIDYLLADHHLIPAGEESAFSEKVVRLPGCYLPTDDTVVPAVGHDSRTEHGLPENGFVFCAFNNSYKLEPLIFGAWMEILTRTPGSVLWLRSTGPIAEANLRREAEARGVAADRLVFESRGLPKPLHLARHRAADLFLDTHFYNAHSTAADALRAGLPVLTFPGQTFPSRVGLSLVSTLGLADELAADSLADYVERAVRLATEPDRLASVRARLAAAIDLPGGLFDTAAFARKLEDAFERLAGRHGSLPRPA